MNVRKKVGYVFTMFAVSLLAICFFSIKANAMEISENGKYSLVLSVPWDDWDADIDGEYEKLIRFNVDPGETTVDITELTKGITAFNGKNVFEGWRESDGSELVKNLSIDKFTESRDISGEEYENGYTLVAKFSDQELKDTGTYYITLDGFAGTLQGKKKLRLTYDADQFSTLDLSEFQPERKECKFVGWDYNGEVISSVDKSVFKDSDVVNITALYKSTEPLDEESYILNFDANGGTLDGEKVKKCNYLGGADSGTSMAIFPYIPERAGYKFIGWNSKKDGSGNNYKYIYWRAWSARNDEESEFERDGLIEDKNMYRNLTLYAKWEKLPETEKKVGKVSLAKASYTYDGKVKKPSVIAKDKNGKKIANSYYSVSYPSGCKKVGNYKVKITFRKPYSGSFTKTFTIIPKGTSVKSLNAAKKKLTVKWAKQTKETTGYQIQYTTDAKFKKSIKTKTISKNKTTSASLGNLKSKKKYYVRIRTYKKAGNAKYYSAWSKIKKAVVK